MDVPLGASREMNDHEQTLELIMSYVVLCLTRRLQDFRDVDSYISNLQALVNRGTFFSKQNHIQKKA
jgi:hypothetical protein